MREDPKLYLLFNHTLTQKQRTDAHETLGTQEIIVTPEQITALWRDIPAATPTLYEMLTPVREYLDQQIRAGDYLLVQGDAGASFLIAQYAIGKGIIPIYATTERKETTEKNQDGKVIKRSVFEHVRYRRYGA